MFCTTNKPQSLWRFELVRRSFLQQPGLPFADALSEERVEQALIDENISFGDEEPGEVVYTPAITLWAFLSQMLFTGAQRSCVAAVARVSVLWASLGQKVCDSNTGAYCRARHKLTEGLVQRLVRETAEVCEAQTPDAWLWRKRHVWLVDGTTVSMPDTPENQAAYPQPPAQKAEGAKGDILHFEVSLAREIPPTRPMIACASPTRCACREADPRQPLVSFQFPGAAKQPPRFSVIRGLDSKPILWYTNDHTAGRGLWQFDSHLRRAELLCRSRSRCAHPGRRAMNLDREPMTNRSCDFWSFPISNRDTSK
jgi:hypothetical protein